MVSGCWQIKIEDDDKDKEAFTSYRGLYHFIHMSFHLQNSHVTFQHAMAVIFSSVSWQSALFYVDDILLFNKTLGQHIAPVFKVLILLYNARASLKLKKGSFFTNTINSINQGIYPRCLRLASNTSDAIHGLKPATRPSKLRSFFRLCHVIRRIVSNFAWFASPEKTVVENPAKKICTSK